APRASRRENARCAHATSTPLASSAAVLSAVRSNGSRGWSGGGQVPGGTELRVIRYAEMNPANSMISVKMNTAMPMSAWSVKPRRGGPGTGRSSGATIPRRPGRARGGGPPAVPAFVARLRRGEAVVESRVLLPALPGAPLHVGGQGAVEQHHERQRDEQ